MTNFPLLKSYRSFEHHENILFEVEDTHERYFGYFKSFLPTSMNYIKNYKNDAWLEVHFLDKAIEKIAKIISAGKAEFFTGAYSIGRNNERASLEERFKDANPLWRDHILNGNKLGSGPRELLKVFLDSNIKVKDLGLVSKEKF